MVGILESWDTSTPDAKIGELPSIGSPPKPFDFRVVWDGSVSPSPHFFRQKMCKNAELDKSTQWLHRSKACMPLRVYSFQVISKILRFFFDI